MKFDREKSKKFILANSNYKKNLKKISKKLSISLLLITMLTSCSNNIDSKITVNNESIIKNEQSIDYSKNFKNLYTSGYVLLKRDNNDKYYCYRLDDLLVVKDNNKYHLVDLKTKMGDIFSHEKIKNNDYKQMIPFKRTSVFYELFLNNEDSLKYENNAFYIIYDYEELQQRIENWDGTKIEKPNFELSNENKTFGG